MGWSCGVGVFGLIVFSLSCDVALLTILIIIIIIIIIIAISLHQCSTIEKSMVGHGKLINYKE